GTIVTDQKSFTALCIDTMQRVTLGGTSNGLYYYRDSGGGTWLQSSEIGDAKITSIVHPKSFFASTEHGIYLSPDGLKWSPIDTMTNAKLAFETGTETVIAVSPSG